MYYSTNIVQMIKLGIFKLTAHVARRERREA